VMDNRSDEFIVFNEEGVCNYWTDALNRKNITYFPNEEGKKKIEEMVNLLKQEGKGKKYDCLMGISGGLDSSYLAYLGYKWGLRILAVHIDDGFDTSVAKENIEKLCKKTNMELLIEKPNAEQFYDLTRAYVLAEVPNIAIPQDNILFAYLYKYVKKYNVRYFLSGTNFSLESINQRGNTYNAYDIVNIKDIHRKFGTISMNQLPLVSYPKRIIDKYLYKTETLKPLDFLDYNRERAIEELKNFCDFNYYSGKHLENDFTIFAQVLWFYKKFNVDKRRSHLSSMIISNQMTREKALLELEKPVLEEVSMEPIINNVLNKLNIGREEFHKIMQRTGKQHSEYKTSNLDKLTLTIMERRRKYLMSGN
ncbi:hypothetical protein V7111_26525, partial [Neobacillus niacini]|uniref:hypothetical protein n=1 Tax=Neobacillus niacini TaxID=86668 RepID=UPI003001EE2B